MRNWNKASQPASLLKNWILSYLWGIETPFNRPNKQQIPGFYLTYEELKHDKRCWKNDRMGWFYLTYEELKLSGRRMGTTVPFRFYLTYEELKLGFMIKSQLRGVDFILPMRNWNLKQSQTEPKQSRDFILPMRNWNPRTPAVRATRGMGFYLTYEELKRIFRIYAHSVNGKILSYLWGIETGSGCDSLHMGRADFILPMRNWNLSTVYIRRSRFQRFYLTYEELKLK